MSGAFWGAGTGLHAWDLGSHPWANRGRSCIRASHVCRAHAVVDAPWLPLYAAAATDADELLDSFLRRVAALYEHDTGAEVWR